MSRGSYFQNKCYFLATTIATMTLLLRTTGGLLLPKHTGRHTPLVFLKQKQQWMSSLAVSSTTSSGSGDGTAIDGPEEKKEELRHPDQFGKIPLPASLSPSAVLEFKKCPQSYLLQYLYKLRQPTSLAMVKGTMCHSALENLFDLDPPSRTLDTLQNLYRVSWAKERLSDKYRFLFESENEKWDWDAEKEWGKSALGLLQNYYEVEDPREVKRPNPLRREVWLHCHLPVDPSLGSTVPGNTGGTTSRRSKSADTFYMRGIVDRLDMVKLPPKEEGAPSRGVALKIVDYKTGKAPTLKYSKPVNDRIVEENFYQLKVYALLLREKGAKTSYDDDGPGLNTLDLRYLELLYLNSESGKAKPWRYDLGETHEQREAVLQGVHQDLSQVWQDISDLVALQDPKAFVGCDRSFCHCHKCRETFVPGTLWEPDQ
jgi:RecB family exonuclease